MWSVRPRVRALYFTLQKQLSVDVARKQAWRKKEIVDTRIRPQGVRRVYLLIFIVEQNLVGIDAVVSVGCYVLDAP